MSMCPNIWVQCLKVKQEHKRHNLKIIIFRRPHLLFGYRYKILDSRSHSCTTIICSEEKNKTDVNVYVGSTRDLDDKFLLLRFSISSTQNVKTYVQTQAYIRTYTHKLSFITKYLSCAMSILSDIIFYDSSSFHNITKTLATNNYAIEPTLGMYVHDSCMS